jgi:RNA polymerase sigma-70 factor (ECF subfamily)
MTVSSDDLLAERFERCRPRLRAVAYRMLGSRTEADDAVQEAWLRLTRTDHGELDNLDAWLTTVVGRICLDMLRSRDHRREEPIDDRPSEPAASGDGADPEQEALLADSVGLALLVVLDTLTPAERLAFVLHDMFAISFDEIAPIVGRSPAATRQLASRARRRVQGAAATPDVDVARQREIVDAFLAASRGGEFDTLLTLLDPDVVLRADAVLARHEGTSALRGSRAVAAYFSGRAQTAAPAVIDGAAGAVVRTPAGKIWLALSFSIANGRIIAIEAVADPDQLRELEIQVASA